MKKALRRALPWLGALVLVAFVCRAVNLSQFAESLRASDWRRWLLAGVLALGPITLVRTLRFKDLLGSLSDSIRPLSTTALLPVVLRARAYNTVLPARFGEVFRLAQVHSGFGCPIESVLAAIVLETVLELVSFTTLAAIFLPEQFQIQPNRHVALLLLAGLAGLLALSAVLLRSRRARVFFTSIARFRSPRAWLRALGWTLLSDLIDVCMIGLCLSAVGISLSPASWCAILVLINISIALPTPGNLGTLEAGALLALGALGAKPSAALAFALLYHSAHVLPVLLCAMMLDTIKISSALKRAFKA